MRMPENFLWDGATAANQCEGAYDQGGRGAYPVWAKKRIERAGVQLSMEPGDEAELAGGAAASDGSIHDPYRVAGFPRVGTVQDPVRYPVPAKHSAQMPNFRTGRTGQRGKPRTAPKRFMTYRLKY